MERELLLEIGCEELPATWLPGLTAQLAEVLGGRLDTHGIGAGAAVETYATPRRLTARVRKLLERQPDLDESVTGPPVAAAFDADGAPTRAGLGFAKKHGVDIGALDQVDTPKGRYLAHRRTARGRATVDVLPNVLTDTLRNLSFAKKMRWDAVLPDGRGELLFGRPIRWLVFLYGGRVVPYVIERSPLAASEHVQHVRSGAVTYGHRFLATSGRAGRALKVKTFDDYRARLAEQFVVLDRQERRDRIARELDAHAARLGGRVALRGAGQSRLLDEVPDLVEYPSVVAGSFDREFLDLPEEVLTTAMIHHQHYFPVAAADGPLLPAFLAVTNTEPDDAGTIAGNAERVLAARLRDAQFFWAADRAHPLDSRMDRLGTLVLHARVGSYRDKALRLEALAPWIAANALERPADVAHVRLAGRLAKIDLTTDMVREFTELQGAMGGIYARAEGLPDEVWKAIYHQYLPVGVDRDEPPTAEDLGSAAGCWASLTLADRVDTLVGLHGAGERPSGTRDPFAMRRLAHGLMKVLVDLPELADCEAAPSLGTLVDQACQGIRGALGDDPDALERVEPSGLRPLYEFLIERLRHLFETRGVGYDELNAVIRPFQERLTAVAPLDIRRRIEALHAVRVSEDFEALALLFKRVKNIARELPHGELESLRQAEPDVGTSLVEAAERDLWTSLGARRLGVQDAVATGDYRRAFLLAAELRPGVDRFFEEVFVMVDDDRLRRARLRLMADLRDLVLSLADISELVPRTET